MTRRATLIGTIILAIGSFSAAFAPLAVAREKRLNILWLRTEDIGPQLACYGDNTDKTPNLDALANKGMVYDIAWFNFPVGEASRATQN